MHDSLNHWLAYRYLTGELSDVEAASFESQLADDLSLQTALAECVALTTGLAHVAQSPAAALSRPSMHSTRRSLAWAGGVACLLGLVVLLINSVLVEPDLLAHRAGQDLSLDSTILAMWSDLAADDELRSPHRDDQLRLDRSGDAELDVPDWMLLAVLHEPVEGDESSLPEEQQL